MPTFRLAMGPDRCTRDRLVARCCHGALFGFGFVFTVLAIVAMFWVAWCYFGLAIIQTSNSQRRAAADWSISSPKTVLPSPTTASPIRSTTSTFGETSSNSISKLPTTESLLRGSSRGESQVKFNKKKEAAVISSLAKGDFASRERGTAPSDNATAFPPKVASTVPSPRGPPKKKDELYSNSGEKASILTASDDSEEDRIYPRRVLPPGSENRPEEKVVINENSRLDISPTKVYDSSINSDTSRAEKPPIRPSETRSSDYPERGVQSSRRSESELTTVYRDPDSNRDYSRQSTSYIRGDSSYDDLDDERGSRGRYDKRDRGRESDDRLSKGDTRVYPDDRDSTVDRDDRYRVRERYPDDAPRRGDDDRDSYRDYDDRPRSQDRGTRYRDRDLDDRPPLRDERYRDDDRYRPKDDKYPDEPRYRPRDGDRYVSRDDDDRYVARGNDKLKSASDDRYKYRDDERYIYREDERYRNDDRYRNRDEDRYRSRDEYRDRSRDEDRNRSRDDDRYRNRDDDRYRNRDDDRYRTRSDDGYRSDIVGTDDKRDNYRSRGDSSTTRVRDEIREISPTDDRRQISSRSGYDSRVDETAADYDRYKNQAKDDTSRRPSNDEYRYRERDRDRDRDDSYRRPSRYDDEDRRIAPTRTRSEYSDTKSSLIDTRRRENSGNSRYTVDDRERPIESSYYNQDRDIQGSRSSSSVGESSRRYSDDKDQRYRTRLPNERNDDYKGKEEVVLNTRSYASEERDEYRKGNSKFDDEYDDRTRRPIDEPRRYKDEESYPRRDPIDDRSRDYERDRTRSRDDDYRRYDDRYPARDDRLPPLPMRKYDDERSTRRDTDGSSIRRESIRDREESSPSYSRGEYTESRRRYDDDSSIPDRGDERYSRGSRKPTNANEPSIASSSTSLREPTGIVIREKRFQTSNSQSSRSSGDDSTNSRRYYEAEPKSPEEVRPLGSKDDVIAAATRYSDGVSQNARKVDYPVFHPQSSNLTSPEFIRPDDRRGSLRSSKKKRSA